MAGRSKLSLLPNLHDRWHCSTAVHWGTQKGGGWEDEEGLLDNLVILTFHQEHGNISTSALIVVDIQVDYILGHLFFKRASLSEITERAASYTISTHKIFILLVNTISFFLLNSAMRWKESPGEMQRN